MGISLLVNMRAYVCGVFSLLVLNTAFAQQKVEGIVRDEGGKPLAGVTVSVSGFSGRSVQTASDGGFHLDLAAPDTVVFSSVGFESLKLPAKPGDKITVTLLESASELEEVVVVGYGTQRRGNLTGSVSSVDGDDLVKRPVMRASSALQGMAAGVTVSQSSGKPGADGGTIRIRGIGTLGDSNPLVLIDGVNGSLDGVDPNDIESVSVLKDAASAAIYGSRAANGVILVTTKTGKDGKVALSYEGFVGKQAFTDLPEMVDGYTYMVKDNEARSNVGLTPLYSSDFLADYQAHKATDPDHYPDNDWQKLLYTGSGVTQRHHVSVNGGNTVKVMASFSYQDQQGLVPGFNYESYGLRLNTQTQISEKVKLETFLSGRHSPVSSPVMGDGVVGGANRIPAIYTARLSDGRWGVAKDGYNPLASVEDGGSTDEFFNSLRLTGQLTYSIIDGLDVEASFTPNISDYSSKRFDKTIETFLPGESTPAYRTPSVTKLTQSERQSWENTTRFLAKYDKQFGSHSLNVLAGFEQIAFKQRQMSAYREGFNFPDLPELGAGGKENWTNDGTSTSWSLRSYFGRVNYNFDERYLLEANLRVDGSSRFDKRYRYGVFPSVSAGWVVSNEDFLRDNDWLSFLKLRASWGKLGNQNIGSNFPYTSYLSLDKFYLYNGKPVPTAILQQMANDQISWETSTSKNIGLDFTLFNNLNVNFDVYQRRTSGILLELDIPAIIGLTAPYQNAGVVDNTGWDLMVNYRNRIGAFTYSVGGNLSNVKNEVVDLKGTGPYITGYRLIEEGYPINALFGYRSNGLFQTQSELDAAHEQFGTVALGDIRYVDVTGDNVVNADDRTVIGNPIPRMNFGINLYGEYKGFDLSVFLQGVGKRDVILTNDAAWALYNNNNMQVWQLDSWTPDNPDAKYPRLVSGSTHNNFQYADYWVNNGAYMRIKNIQLGYTFDTALFKKLGLQRTRIYASGDNIATFHNMFPGWDPERPDGDSSPYPLASTYVFGVSLTF